MKLTIILNQEIFHTYFQCECFKSKYINVVQNPSEHYFKQILYIDRILTGTIILSQCESDINVNEGGLNSQQNSRTGASSLDAV